MPKRHHVNEICAQLEAAVRLKPVPTALLRLCAEFSDVPPFRNKVVNTFQPSESKRSLSVECYRGDYYISVNNQVHVMSHAGELIRKWDLIDPLPRDAFQNSEHCRLFPHALCVAEDRVYVAYGTAGRCDNGVHVYDTRGVLIRKWSIQVKINGIAVHQGHVFVSDLVWHCISVFDTDGTFLRRFGVMGTGKGELHSPSGLLITSLGELWVVDSKSGNVQAFNPQGTFLRTICINLKTPWNLVERGDQILVSSAFSLSVFTVEGTLIDVFPYANQIQGVLGLSVNDDGYLVAADMSHIIILE